MNVLTSTTSFRPYSLQLKLALDCRKYPLVIAQAHLPEPDRCRLSYVSIVGWSSSMEGRGMERHRNGNPSWVRSSNSADNFSGWASSSNEERQSVDSKDKQSFVGILGAGVAGVFLVAGLTFAALSIANRSPIKNKQQMEPLTRQQQNSLSLDNHQDQDGEENSGLKLGILERRGEESKTNEDLSLDKENIGPYENRFNRENCATQLVENSDRLERTSIQDDTQSSSSLSSDSFISDSAADGFLPTLSLESEDASFTSQKLNVLAIENLANAKFVDSSTLVFDANTEIAVTEPPNEISSLNSDASIEKLPIKLQSDANTESGFIYEQFVECYSLLSMGDVDQKQELSTMVVDPSENVEISANEIDLSPDWSALSGTFSMGEPPNEQCEDDTDDINVSRTLFDTVHLGNFVHSAGIPAPSAVSAALQTTTGKVLVPAVVDQLQSQALSALQVLKVIEDNVQPGDICSRREYARWLVLASSILSRTTTSKVYPAMYIENVSKLAFNDVTPDDPDFPFIQGLAEAGLIASKLSKCDMQSSLDDDSGLFLFSPESSCTRQDLVSWKMAIEKKQLPVVDRQTLQQVSGFIDIDKIDPDAWPSLVADLASGEQGITALAFGYTRLFQPEKPVTKAQAAIALSTGDAATMVSEELARIEAESMAEKAVAAHSALVSQVEKDLNASYEKELSMEKKKIDAVEKMANEAILEVERLRGERDEEYIRLTKERAAVDSEMEVFSRLRRELEEELQIVMTEKLEISHEKERMNKLRKDAETDSQEISRLQYELEVERKALSMARSWAEDEAKNAREQAKVLEEARGKWERQGLKVIVDDELREEEANNNTWGKQHFSVEETVGRSENLVDKLSVMANEIKGKCKDTIHQIIDKIFLLISNLKEKAELIKDSAKNKMDSFEFTGAVRENVKRVAGDWKHGVERLTQKFKI